VTATVKTRFNIYRKKQLLLALLFLVLFLLFSSFVIYKLSISDNNVNVVYDQPVDGAAVDDSVFSLDGTVYVASETGLKTAINNTFSSSSTSATIALNKDITLTEALVISTNKNIILTSNRTSGFCRLFGASDENTITVETDGQLRLDNIIVTHANGIAGRGAAVCSGGTLILLNGEIVDNFIVGGSGGGGVLVYSGGYFKMMAGKIANNRVTFLDSMDIFRPGGITASGGGIKNDGTISMSGGTITNNTADSLGGGVHNSGKFIMTGGSITKNTGNAGGGVYVYLLGSFTLSNGEVSNNIAIRGGGVCVFGDFTMSNGKITDNSVSFCGGGVYVESGDYSSFNIIGGTISGNTAAASGGGVYNGKIFTNSGGKIFNNKANSDNDVFNSK